MARVHPNRVVEDEALNRVDDCAAGIPIGNIFVSADSVLDELTVVAVVEALRKSIAERSHLRNALTALAGVQFDTTDYLAYFMNEYGEQIVFRQGLGDPLASLLHSDFDWEPIVFDPEVVTGAQRAARMGVRTVSDSVHVPGAGRGGAVE